MSRPQADRDRLLGLVDTLSGAMVSVPHDRLSHSDDCEYRRWDIFGTDDDPIPGCTCHVVKVRAALSRLEES